MGCTVEPTGDVSRIKAMLTRDDIWCRAAEDVLDKATYEPIADNSNLWLMVVKDNEDVGIIYIHPETGVSFGFHPYLLPKHKMLGREMITEFFKFFVEKMKRKFVKINVVVPKCHKSVGNFAKNVGFTHEGTSRDSYLHNGVVYDRDLYGITRTEVEALL